MGKLIATLDARVHTALVICLCFLLGSTGWLSWLYRLMALTSTAPVEFLTMVCSYLAQGAGIWIYLLALRTGDYESRSRQLFTASLALYPFLLAPATLISNLAITLVAGYAFNVLCGIMQGYYLSLLRTQVQHDSRGTVFGCAYGASTLLTWLLSLPAGGTLSQGLPCLLLCLVISAATYVLTYTPYKAQAEQEDALPDDPPLPESVMLLIYAVITLASTVRTAGFSFPTNDLALGTNLELSRLLYGLGLVLTGLISDHDRSLGFGLCAISLAMPLLMLALSGAGMSGMSLWALGYLLAGIYVLFSVLLTVDNAAEPRLAGTGMLFRHIGDALGCALYLALGQTSITLICVTAALLTAAMSLLFALYQQLYAQPSPTDHMEHVAEPKEPDEQEVFERFATNYQLSLRERDVLRQVLAEKSNAQIATELSVTERTVKFHISNLLKKTGCKNRLEILALYALDKQRVQTATALDNT